jgi:NitT/TauT family transport system ATP-binding protein
VHGNVRFALELQRWTRDDLNARATRFLRMVGLGDFADYHPHQLSGGMRQRVNIARALAVDPQVLLMDEPFGALDAQLKLVMHQQLLDVWQAHRKTVVFVTHDLAEALMLADRVVVLGARPGRIKADFTVPIGRPRDVFTLQFESSFTDMERQLWEVMRADMAQGEAM